MIVLVAALTGALAAGGGFSWLPRLALSALGDDAEPEPAPAALAFLDRAIASADGDAPPLNDAVQRLAGSVRPDTARALAIDRLLRRYAAAGPGRREALADPSWALADDRYDGLGPATAAVWSEETPRAPSVARIVSRQDERAWAMRQRPTTAGRVVGLATSAAVGLATAVSPELSVSVALMDAGAAALADTTNAIPAGSRTDDALICRFVWRRNAARPGWAPDHPVGALHLSLGRRVGAVELTVVRAGRIESHLVVRSDATTC